jgi:protein gp37
VRVLADTTGISWCDFTFNPWIGCDEVSPACDFCYARALAERYGWAKWGTDEPRYRTSKGNWDKVKVWNDHHAAKFYAKHGHWPRVFAASLADIFDNKVPPEWRADFWALVKRTPKLQWLIVTKRIPNVERMLPPDWDSGAYSHVVLLITTANQQEVDRDVPRLLRLKAKYKWLTVGLSVEPMLGPIKLQPYWIDPRLQNAERSSAERDVFLDWVIAGGESRQHIDGEAKRDLVPLLTEWIRDLAKQCERAHVAFHFKQWGYTIAPDQVAPIDPMNPGPNKITYIGDRLLWKKHHGRRLDGVEHNDFPTTLRIAA